MDRLIYVSQARGLAPQAALEDILSVSVWSNARLDITGALAFCDLRYVQLLEGPPHALDDLMGRLQADPRHTDIDVLYRLDVPRRMVPGWSMARADLAEHSAQASRLIEQRDGLALTTLLTTLVAKGETQVA